MDFSSKSNPVISVVMPCFNGARWIAESIDSVLNQTFEEFELIIIDGGSSDGSIDIIHNYIKKDSRIVLIEKPSLGLSASLNLGIDIARGEWIARLDADDISEPKRLASQLQAAINCPTLVFIGSGLTEIDEHGTLGKKFLYPTTHKKLINNLVRFKRFPPHSSAFYRKDIVLQAGGYRTEIKRAEDLDLWLRLSELGDLGSIPECLVRYRKHLSQTSNFEGGIPQMIDARVAVVGYWLRIWGQPDASRFDHPQYQAFREFITEKYAKYFKFHAGRDKLTARFTGKNTTRSLFASMLKLCVTNLNFVFWLVHFQIVGEDLAPNFAKEWMRKQALTSAKT